MAITEKTEPDPGNFLNKVSLPGVIISTGIVFGDLGTSPLYTYTAVFTGGRIQEATVLGVLSLVIWTLTFQVTLKYILLTFQADNKGEGGIFALYALVKRYRRWTVVPAILGGSFLLADAIITPPISVSSAIEGLRVFRPELDTVPLVLGIIVFLFGLQFYGTQSIGRIFGPIMLCWFLLLFGTGLYRILDNPGVFRALNPMYGFRLLTDNPDRLHMLGGIFLCCTGAEALYADMGHVGRNNIRISWVFVKIALIASYAGQSAWLLSMEGQELGRVNPFFGMMPYYVQPPAIVLATLAAIIASQALISGAFTLVNEAMRLGFWPRLKIVYPTIVRGQIYVPAINWLFMAGCIGIVLYFREARRMEAAYGLAVCATMLSTTLMMQTFFQFHKGWVVGAWIITMTFLFIEGTYLVANLQKFTKGGWISIFLGMGLVYIMYIRWYARQLKMRHTVLEPFPPRLPALKKLGADKAYPKIASHLVYLTSANTPEHIETRVIHSIFHRAPKRAEVYWFIHVNVVDEPYASTFSVETLAEKEIFWIRFDLGFRIEPRIHYLFRLVMENMTATGQVDWKAENPYADQPNEDPDICFVTFRSFLSYENDLPAFERTVLESYFLLKRISLSIAASYGLDQSNVLTEKVPLVIVQPRQVVLIRDEIPVPAPGQMGGGEEGPAGQKNENDNDRSG